MFSKHLLKDLKSPITSKKKRKETVTQKIENITLQKINTELENSECVMRDISDLRIEKNGMTLLLWVYSLSSFHFTLHY